MPTLNPRTEIESTWRRFLFEQEPELMRSSYRIWKSQQDQLTRNDAIEASRTGRITSETQASWDLAYERFTGQTLPRYWTAAGGLGADLIRLGIQRVRQDEFDRYEELFGRWVEERSGSLIVGLSSEQRKSIRNLLRHHLTTDPLSPRELAKVLRPIVPLTSRQERAVRRRRIALISKGLTGRALERAVGRYARRQQQVRAFRIARTELAMAFNQGQLSAIEAEVAEGRIEPEVFKEWLTAQDERVCPICGPLDETRRLLEESFTSGGFTALVPPIHPNCRCTVAYDATPITDEVTQRRRTDENRQRRSQDHSHQHQLERAGRRRGVGGVLPGQPDRHPR